MYFNNVVAYCKGWYARREGGLRTAWMDLAHCILSEGAVVQTKTEVVDWCMWYLDGMKKDRKLTARKLITFEYFIKEVRSILNRLCTFDNENASIENAIIKFYIETIRYLDGSFFDSGIVPSERVLPIDKSAQLSTLFGKYTEQDIPEGKYDEIEAFLIKDSWKDVQPNLSGEDYKPLVLTGDELINHVKDDKVIDLGIYRGCKDFDKDKDYVTLVSYRQIFDDYDELVVHSIREQTKLKNG